MNNQAPRPKALLTEYAKRYPGAWRQADMFRQDKGKDLPDWPNWCFLPLATARITARRRRYDPLPVGGQDAGRSCKIKEAQLTTGLFCACKIIQLQPLPAIPVDPPAGPYACVHAPAGRPADTLGLEGFQEQLVGICPAACFQAVQPVVQHGGSAADLRRVITMAAAVIGESME